MREQKEKTTKIKVFPIGGQIQSHTSLHSLHFPLENITSVEMEARLNHMDRNPSLLFILHALFNFIVQTFEPIYLILLENLNNIQYARWEDTYV